MTASAWPWAEIAAVYVVGMILTAWWLRITMRGAPPHVHRHADRTPVKFAAILAAVVTLWPIFWIGIVMSLIVFPPRDKEGTR